MPVMRAPINDYKEVRCNLDDKWQRRLASYEEDEAVKFAAQNKAKLKAWHLDPRNRGRNVSEFKPLKADSLQLMRCSRIYASWPKLLDLAHTDDETFYSWSQNEWDKWSKYNTSLEKKDRRKDIFETNLAAIVASSAKAQWIQACINHYARVKDARGKRPRVVICSEHFTSTRIIYLVSSLHQWQINQPLYTNITDSLPDAH